MKPRYKNIISVSVLLILIAWFAYYLMTHASDFKQLSLVNPAYIIYVVMITIVFFVTNGLILKYLVEPFNIKLVFREWFGLSVVTNFYNVLNPFGGGAIARASYLKKKHNFPYTDFLATLAGVRILNLALVSLLGLISVLLIYVTHGIFNSVVLLVFLASFLAFGFIILFSPALRERKGGFAGKLSRIMNGWNLIRKNKRTVGIISLITSIQLILGVLDMMLSYYVFGISIGFFKAMFLFSISYLSTIISITPGALGISEGVQVFSALAVGIKPAQSIAVAILGRALSTLPLFILGPLFSYILLRMSNMKPFT